MNKFLHFQNHSHDDIGFVAIISFDPQDPHLVFMASSRALKKLYLYFFFGWTSDSP